MNKEKEIETVTLMVRRYCWGVHGTRGEALGRYSLPQFFFLRSHSGLPGMTNITMSGVPCSWTPACFPGLAVSDRFLVDDRGGTWPSHTIDSMTEIYHFTLSHYGLPDLCPTLKRHCWPLTLQGLDTGGLPSLTRPDSHRLYACHRTGAHPRFFHYIRISEAGVILWFF